MDEAPLRQACACGCSPVSPRNLCRSSDGTRLVADRGSLGAACTFSLPGLYPSSREGTFMPTGRLRRYTQRFAIYLEGVTHSAWQIARTPRERVEAIRFLLTFLAVKMGYRLARSLPPDLTLRVRGLTWHVGVHATELSVLGEVYVQRVYDRHPDFVPRRGW